MSADSDPEVDEGMPRFSGAAPEPSEPIELNEAEIAAAAYQLYEDNGREDGHDLEHWLAAEDALRRGL
jgi:hypothetical protein